MKTQKTQNIQGNPEKEKNRAGGIRLPHFRLYYKATINQTVWYWHKNRNRSTEQDKKKTEISPCTYSQLIYDKRSKTTQCGNDSLFNK